MILEKAEVRQLLYCCAEELRARARGKHPGPQPWLSRLVRRLELEVALSRSRQDEGGETSCSNHEWICTRDAATRLGWTARQVQRRAADLEGRKTSAGWIFPAAAVDEYAEAMTDGRTVA